MASCIWSNTQQDEQPDSTRLITKSIRRCRHRRRRRIRTKLSAPCVSVFRGGFARERTD